MAAGNPPEYNKSVREFDVVTLDRIRRIDVEENYGVWREYAGRPESIRPSCPTWSLRGIPFTRWRQRWTAVCSPPPRGWEDLSEFLKACEAVGKKADREVVHQYIQHWKIAKDFANYLELFSKYKKDYGLERILEGQYGADTLEKLKFASFDERRSVVGMLLGKLSELFRDSYLSDRYVTKLFGCLKEYKACGSLEEAAGAAAERYENLRRAGQLTREADHMLRQVNDTLDRYQQLLKEERLTAADQAEAAFERVRSEFEKETRKREEFLERTGRALDNAFYFMEDAFGDSQEMVSFVTELNTNYYSIQFLKENDCDMYCKYNKRLLVDEQRGEAAGEDG